MADGPGGTPTIVVAVLIFGLEGDLRGLAEGIFRLGTTTLNILGKLHVASLTLAALHACGRGWPPWM